MPGCVPRTSTISLNNATIPFISNLALNGLNSALGSNENFLNGLNIMSGMCTQQDVAKDLNLEFCNSRKLIA